MHISPLKGFVASKGRPRKTGKKKDKGASSEALGWYKIHTNSGKSKQKTIFCIERS